MTKRKIKQVIIIFITTIIILVLGVLIILTVTEYRPKNKEKLNVHNQEKNSIQSITKGDSIKILTWNIGYGALGDNADFFMDGGSHVTTATSKRVKQNIHAVTSQLNKQDPDIVFLQEVDQNSKRSHHINERKDITNAMNGYQWSFANNFKVAYVPYPFPPIGKVDSGILTLSRYNQTNAERISLPCPFRWPVKMANLKRCLMVNRIPLSNTDKELVLINLHLEAYDDGEGKAKQTKALLKVMNEEVKKGNYVIAGGDFNQTFSNVDATKFKPEKDKWTPGIIDEKEFKDNFTLQMDDSSPTCRSLDKPYENADHDHFLSYMLDGFIVSKNVKIQSIKTTNLQFKNSDHNPVTMTVRLE